MIMGMLRTADIDVADTVSESDKADFLTNAAWESKKESTSMTNA